MLKKLPFPEDFTFSLEFEFSVKAQPFPLTENDYNREAMEFFLRNHLVLPSNWVLAPPHSKEPTADIFELKTASCGKIYHENREEEWETLKKDIATIQEYLKGGFGSLHLHIGRKSKTTPDNKLIVDKKYFGALIKVYEAMWCALAGLNYAAPPKGRVFTTYGIDFMQTGNFPEIYPIFLNEIVLDVRWHRGIINLSTLFPTIEIKIMGYLLEKGLIDCSKIPENFSWAFSLFHCVTEEARFVPLAQMGIPTPAHTKPSWKQIHRFLDIVFVNDTQGKDMALKQFIDVEHIILDGSEMLTICRKLESASPFYALGMGVVYELHENNEGYASDVETIILDSSSLLENLCHDLRHAQAKWPLEKLFGNLQLIQKIKKSTS